MHSKYTLKTACVDSKGLVQPWHLIAGENHKLPAREWKCLSMDQSGPQMKIECCLVCNVMDFDFLLCFSVLS